MDQRDAIGQATAREGVTRHRYLVLGVLQRGHVAVDGGCRFGQPQRGIAIGGADFQYPARSAETYQHRQEFAGVGRDVEHAPAALAFACVVFGTETGQFALHFRQVHGHLRVNPPRDSANCGLC